MTDGEIKSMERMKQEMSDGIKMTYILSKEIKKAVMGSLNDLNNAMKMSALLAIIDTEKAMGIVDAGMKLEKTINKLNKNLDDISEQLKEISGCTKEDEKRIEEMARKQKNGMLSDEDNNKLNELFKNEAD